MVAESILHANAHPCPLRERNEVTVQRSGLLFAFQPAFWLKSLRFREDIGIEEDIVDGVTDGSLEFKDAQSVFGSKNLATPER